MTRPITNETRTQRRERFARALTEETGHQVRAHPSCYALWDAELGYMWSPLYTQADVRRKAREIEQREPIR